jgi:hypothetical protein
MYKALKAVSEDPVHPTQKLTLHDTQNRLGNYHWLAAQTVSRQMRIYKGLWNVTLQPPLAASLWNECLTLQAAVMQRLATQQMQWIQGLEAIAAEIGNLKKANTLSKLMDQDTDISGRLNALIMGQAASTMELLENVHINIGYLVAQKEQEAMR